MKHRTTILTSRQHELDARLDPAWQPETEAPVVGTGNLVREVLRQSQTLKIERWVVVHVLVGAPHECPP